MFNYSEPGYVQAGYNSEGGYHPFTVFFMEYRVLLTSNLCRGSTRLEESTLC